MDAQEAQKLAKVYNNEMHLEDRERAMLARIGTTAEDLRERNLILAPATLKVMMRKSQESPPIEAVFLLAWKEGQQLVALQPGEHLTEVPSLGLKIKVKRKTTNLDGVDYRRLEVTFTDPPNQVTISAPIVRGTYSTNEVFWHADAWSRPRMRSRTLEDDVRVGIIVDGFQQAGSFYVPLKKSLDILEASGQLDNLGYQEMPLAA